MVIAQADRKATVTQIGTFSVDVLHRQHVTSDSIPVGEEQESEATVKDLKTSPHLMNLDFLLRHTEAGSELDAYGLNPRTQPALCQQFMAGCGTVIRREPFLGTH